MAPGGFSRARRIITTKRRAYGSRALQRRALKELRRSNEFRAAYLPTKGVRSRRVGAAAVSSCQTTSNSRQRSGKPLRRKGAASVHQLNVLGAAQNAFGGIREQYLAALGLGGDAGGGVDRLAATIL